MIAIKSSLPSCPSYAQGSVIPEPNFLDVIQYIYFRLGAMRQNLDKYNSVVT